MGDVVVDNSMSIEIKTTSLENYINFCVALWVHPSQDARSLRAERVQVYCLGGRVDDGG